MKVMLVNPRPLWDRLGPMERFSPAIPPLGIVWPATVLAQQGHEVRVVDQHARKWTSGQLLEEVGRFTPELVGFSCLTFSMDGVQDAVAAIRGRYPDTVIVLGNLHATLFHRELVAAGVADYVVRGEAEGTLPALVNALAAGKTAAGMPGITCKQNGEIAAGPDAGEADLSGLPVPDWNLVADTRYEAFRLRQFDAGTIPAAVQASRGCQFDCTFCSQNVMYPRLRNRPVERVVDEIEALHKDYGVTAFGFVDANFPPTRKYGTDFAALMVARGLHDNVRWFTEVRLDLVDRPLLKDLARAGLALVQFGVESGDREVLEKMGKGAGWTDAHAPFKWCRELGILTVGLFVIGMPGETEKQIRRTIETAVALDPDLAKFSVATPYPGSGLWYEYHDELKDAPPHKFSGWLDPARGGPHLLENHTLPTIRLARLQRRAMRRFYLRPRKLAALFGAGLLRGETLVDGFVSTMSQTIDNLAGAARSVLGLSGGRSRHGESDR